MCMNDEVIKFINRRFPSDSNWLNGNCYYFALILQDRFNGEIFYDVIFGHFITKIKDKFYDYAGEVDLKDRKLIKWKYFEEYDYLQKMRIIKDCIN